MSSATRVRGDDFAAQVREKAKVDLGLTEEQAWGLDGLMRDLGGGQNNYILREAWSTRIERDQRIRADRAAGRSLGWIANRYCLSRSTVFGILQAVHGSDPRDPAAFC